MEKPEIHYKPKVSEIIASLPEYLKDPANFEEIQAKVIKSFRSSCFHSEVFEWVSCVKCTEKMEKRRALLKQLGFKNPRQYLTWVKIHKQIKESYPLVDWSKKQFITP